LRHAAHECFDLDQRSTSLPSQASAVIASPLPASTVGLAAAAAAAEPPRAAEPHRAAEPPWKVNVVPVPPPQQVVGGVSKSGGSHTLMFVAYICGLPRGLPLQLSPSHVVAVHAVRDLW